MACTAMGLAGCGGSGAEANVETAATQMEAEPVDTAEACSAVLQESVARFLNETEQGDDSMVLAMLFGRSALSLEVAMFTSALTQELGVNGTKSANQMLADGVVEFCARPEVREAVLGEASPLPVADFPEGSTEYRCVRIIYPEIIVGIGLPAPSEAAMDRAYHEWLVTLGSSSPLLGPLARAAADAASAQFEHGQRHSYPIIANNVNELCADPVLAGQALRLVGEDAPHVDRSPSTADLPPLDADEPGSFDEYVAGLESSADVPANNTSHVAQQIALAIQDDDGDRLAQWADFPMPADLSGQLDLDSMSCSNSNSNSNCTVRASENRQVRIALSYADQGWYGQDVSVVTDDSMDATDLVGPPSTPPYPSEAPALATTTNPSATPAPTCAEAGVGAFERGDGWCADIETLQVWLNRWGYPVAVDGYFGPGTEDAVTTFQAEYGLLADGKAGPVTWTLLSDADDWGI